MSRVDVLDFVEIGAVLISVICGSLVILAIAHVWLRKQLLGWGGFALFGFATVLIVAPLFRTIELGAGTTTGVRLEAAQKQVEKATIALEQASTRYALIASALQKQPGITPAEFADIKKELTNLTTRIDQLNANTAVAIKEIRSLPLRPTPGAAMAPASRGVIREQPIPPQPMPWLER